MKGLAGTSFNTERSNIDMKQNCSPGGRNTRARHLKRSQAWLSHHQQFRIQLQLKTSNMCQGEVNVGYKIF